MSLREAAQQALKAMELAGMSHDVMLMSDPPQDAWKARGVYWKLAEAISALRTALAEPTSQESRQVEPVAYIHESGFLVRTPGATLTAGMKLYASPPKREPLTDQQILDLLPTKQNYWSESDTGLWIARAIERAHGIGGEE